MTESLNDGQIDQLVKTGWRAIGLSQADLAEVLGASLQQTATDDDGSNYLDDGRLSRIAEALGLPADFFCSPAMATEPEAPGPASVQRVGSLQSVLALRLLRAFQDLIDLRSKEVLVQLAEQIVKRQTNPRG
jgi:transcriptional regulator with XRE-family HTH domain